MMGVVVVIDTLDEEADQRELTQLQPCNAHYLVMPSFLLSFSRATAKYGSGDLINICHRATLSPLLSTALVYT